MRVSDDERQRAMEELRRHCAAGRLDVDEYASRIERALSATTLAELDELRADLPMMRIAEPGGDRARTGVGPRSTGRPALGSGPSGSGRDTGAGAAGRLGALVVALITVAIVVAAIALSLALEWTWTVVLLGAWAAGLIQGRLGRKTKQEG